MSVYTARVSWHRNYQEVFTDNKYSRGHEWCFSNGTVVPASSSPHIVPLPYSVEANVNPEEAFVACLSSCHMLFFLSIAAKRNFTVDEYEDNAVGMLEKDSNGKMSITRVVLRPKVKFSGGKEPSLDQLENIHQLSHEQCFIANSVKSEVVTEIIG